MSGITYGAISPRDFNQEFYDNRDYVFRVLDSLPNMGSLICGGSKGVEKRVEEWAEARDVAITVIPPNTRLHGREQAFLERNTQILSRCDSCILFWDGVAPLMISVASRAMFMSKRVLLFPAL